MKTVRIFLRFLSILCLVGVICFTPTISMAGWFDKFKNSTVVNHGSAWESQQRGYFAGGGVSIRTPTDTSSFVSLTMPRVEIGCGGIDAFWGGFSFLDPEYLIEKFKNILQAAPAYAFDLALTQLCQSCANILKSLEAIVNELNSLALDDCAAAQALANAGTGFVLDKMQMGSATGTNNSSGAKYLSEKLKAMETGLSSFRSEYNKLLDYKYGCGNAGADTAKCRELHNLEGSIWDLVLTREQQKTGAYKIDESYTTLAKTIFGDVKFVKPVQQDGAGTEMVQGQVRVFRPCAENLPVLIEAMTRVPFSDLAASGDQLTNAKEAIGNTILLFRDDNGDCIIEKKMSHDEVFGSDWEKLFFGVKALNAMLDIKKSMVNGDAVSDDTIKVINQSAVPIYSVLNILNLRIGPRAAAIVGEEEKAVVEMLSASQAFYVLGSMSRTAAELLGEQYIAVLDTNLGLYDPLAIQEAMSILSSNVSYTSEQFISQMEGARERYQNALESITKVQSIKKIFQAILIEKLV